MDSKKLDKTTTQLDSVIYQIQLLALIDRETRMAFAGAIAHVAYNIFYALGDTKPKKSEFLAMLNEFFGLKPEDSELIAYCGLNDEQLEALK